MKLNGYQREMHFENGYGLSIVSHEFSYGGKDGLFEIALLDSETREIIYNPDLGFDDVRGHLDFHEVLDIIEEVKLTKSAKPIKII
jgi:hypothetical protein